MVEDAIVLLRNPPTETFVSTMEPTNRSQLINFFDTIHQQPTLLSDTKHKPNNPPPDEHQDEDPVPALGVPTGGPRRSPRLHQEVATAAINPDTGKAAEYRELIRSTAGPRWTLAMNKELGRLFQGYDCSYDKNHSVQGTDTCTFIYHKDIPTGKTPTYIRIVTDYREQKADPYRVRCTAGGDRIDFHGDVATKVADLVTVKCLLNRIISTPGGRAACIDIKDFYLINPLPCAEYIGFRANTIP